MKVGAKVTVFNFAMRNRRLELGFSQIRLAEMSGVPLHKIITIEALRCPPGQALTVAEQLNKIASTLEIDFDALFPQDYLDMVEAKLLPRRRKPFIWCREMRLSELSPSDVQLQLPSAEEIAFGRVVPQEINAALTRSFDSLSPKERACIERYFGLNGEQACTLEEVAQHFKVTRERVRQILDKAYRKMRSANDFALRDSIYA